MDGVLSQEEISALLNDNSSMDAVTEAEGLEQLTPEEKSRYGQLIAIDPTARQVF